MTRMTSINLTNKRLTISLTNITHQLPRTVVPPPTPYPWVWRCHRCHGGRRFTASNRCLGCSHVFCTRCVSEYDYLGWEQWGAYYKRRCSTSEDTGEGSAAEERCDYKRNRNPRQEDDEDENEEIASLDAFELVLPSTPSLSHAHFGSDSDSESSEEDDQDRVALTPPGNFSPTASDGDGDGDEVGGDGEEDDFQWTLSHPQPYVSTTNQVNAALSFCTYGEESEPMDPRGYNWKTVPLSPTESTPTSGYGGVKEAMDALYSNGEDGETMSDWSGCYSPTSSKGSETAMCGDEDDWDEPLWSPVLLSWDGSI